MVVALVFLRCLPHFSFEEADEIRDVVVAQPIGYFFDRQILKDK
jgi:hypothetical protein